MFTGFLRGNKVHNRNCSISSSSSSSSSSGNNNNNNNNIYNVFLFPVFSLLVAFCKRFCTTNCGVGKS